MSAHADADRREARDGARGRLVRAVLVLCVAAFALHELRYMSWLSDGHHGGGGHRDGWLTLVAPFFTLALAATVGTALARAARQRSGVERAVVMRNLWLIASGTLLASFAGQELLQGALHPGHPYGLHALVGHDGWIVVPLALLLGGLVAALVGVAREIERRWRCASHLRLVWPAPAALAALPAAPSPRARPLAENLAGRSPPLLVV